MRWSVMMLHRKWLSDVATETKMITRDSKFYENWAKKRVFFYQVDLRGRLFLDTPNLLRRNEATCLKSKEFLDFFFQRVKACPAITDPGIVKRRSPTWREAIELFSVEFPYMSPCGTELNLIKADDTPIVFKDLVPSSDPNDDFEYLLYGGSLTEKFDPSRVLVGKKTERVYYKRANGQICLIHAELAQRLSKNFAQDGSNSWEWKSKRYALPVE
jgi:hypothetical protein